MRRKPGRQKERIWAEFLCFGCIILHLWHKVVLRKWLNISSMDSDFSADEGETTESEFEYDGTPTDGVPYKWRRRNSETLRAQYISIKELRICAGTWNVGGKFPPDDLKIKDWLVMDEPADIYVLGLQEIVPLNAGNIFGVEDNSPVSRWEYIIRQTLNKIQPPREKYKSYSDPPSPSRFHPLDDSLGIEDALLQESDSDTNEEIHSLEEDSLVSNASVYCCSGSEAKLSGNTISSCTNANLIRSQVLACRPLSLQKMFEKSQSFNSHPAAEEASTTEQKRLTKTFSCSETIGLLWPERPADILTQLTLDNSKQLKSVKSFKNPNPFKLVNQISKDSARSGLIHELKMYDIVKKKKRSSFVRIISKQMVGIYLSIWVRRSLRKHIHSLKVSSVGVGVMGYIGNKGSISVSMSIYQTLFCFVCCHLTSGEKEGDRLRRNADVQEIHRRTLFHSTLTNDFPKTIYDHERIFWLGDINYRLDLSYEMTRELIARKDWLKLVESDQLKKELKKGRAFDGWSEGIINFPPTYKYELNSGRYIGDDPKVGRRTPAWCDRILSFGKGTRLLDYRRTELKLSDHRPVTAIFMTDVEILSRRKLQRALTFTDAEIEEGHPLSDEDVDNETHASPSFTCASSKGMVCPFTSTDRRVPRLGMLQQALTMPMQEVQVKPMLV